MTPKAAYAEYLKSPRWATLRTEAMSASEWRCMVCGVHSSKSKLECHHRDYKRLGKPGESRDLIAMCARCHKLFHGVESGPVADTGAAPEADTPPGPRLVTVVSVFKGRVVPRRGDK